MLVSLALLGCQTTQRLAQASGNSPVDWWHQLEGGTIAEQRPPPPGVGMPYPNLSQVPTDTPKVDAAQQQALQAQLLNERDLVRRNVLQDPLTPTPPNQPAAPPSLPKDPEASHVVADAATTPAPTTSPGPTPPAPAGPPPSAAASPAPRAAAAPVPPSAAATPRPSAIPDLPAVPPTIPDAPPPFPSLPGVSASLLPAASRPAPLGVAVAFRRESAALPEGAEDALKALAARRGGGPVAIRAGGDAASSPAAQAAALPLALRRAESIRAVLLGAGVPASDIRAQAIATARGARIDLIQSP